MNRSTITKLLIGAGVLVSIKTAIESINIYRDSSIKVAIKEKELNDEYISDTIECESELEKLKMEEQENAIQVVLSIMVPMCVLGYATAKYRSRSYGLLRDNLALAIKNNELRKDTDTQNCKLIKIVYTKTNRMEII